MGEEDKKEGEVKEEKREQEKKKEEEEQSANGEEIVLKVDMHCEACARKVARVLKGFQGVEEVKADYRASEVVVKGKEADPVKVLERIQKKSGRKVVQIISPLPKLPPQENNQENKQDPPKQENKQQPPAVVTVVLKVGMHCESCAQLLQKRIGKIKGVESVTTDIANDQVIVKGVLDPGKLVNDIYKRTGKQASIVKDEEKKDDEKKDEKPEDKKEQSKEEEDDDDKKTDHAYKSEYWPPKCYMEGAYYPPDKMFSDDNPNACSVM